MRQSAAPLVKCTPRRTLTAPRSVCGALARSRTNSVVTYFIVISQVVYCIYLSEIKVLCVSSDDTLKKINIDREQIN